jgi:hypothetical protein
VRMVKDLANVAEDGFGWVGCVAGDPKVFAREQVLFGKAEEGQSCPVRGGVRPARRFVHGGPGGPVVPATPVGGCGT